MRTFLDRSTRRRPLATHARGLLVAGLLAAASHTAAAQVETLDPRIAQSSSLSGADRDRIGTFVGAYAPALSAESFADVRRARSALTAPLTGTGVTVAFRDAYAEALWPTVRDLLDAEDATQRLTGMRLAGLLGTNEPARRLVALLGSEDEGIRVFAAGRLGDVLATVGPTAAGISPETAASIIDALGAAVREDEEPRVADAAARSLEQAALIRAGLLNDARSRAIRVLSESAGARIARSELDEAAVGLALRACGIVRTEVSKNDPATAPAAKAAIGLGAEVLLAVLNTFNPDAPADASRVGAVRAAESVIFYARRRHAEATGSSASFQPTDLAAKLEATDIRTKRDFRPDTLDLLRTIERDYGFEAGRFVPRGP